MNISTLVKTTPKDLDALRVDIRKTLSALGKLTQAKLEGHLRLGVQLLQYSKEHISQGVKGSGWLAKCESDFGLSRSNALRHTLFARYCIAKQPLPDLEWGNKLFAEMFAWRRTAKMLPALRGPKKGSAKKLPAPKTTAALSAAVEKYPTAEFTCKIAPGKVIASGRLWLKKGPYSLRAEFPQDISPADYLNMETELKAILQKLFEKVYK